MGTITIDEARRMGTVGPRYKSVDEALSETVRKQKEEDRHYTIFLSHARLVSDIILGVKRILEKLDHSVYVDWIDDPEMDRSRVTAENAATLRKRMGVCECLFYTTTENSGSSKWMVWECGYFDGKKQRAAILPVTKYSENSFYGEEYLGLYPYVTIDPRKSDSKECLWVNRTKDVYVEFEEWLNGAEPRRHSR